MSSKSRASAAAPHPKSSPLLTFTVPVLVLPAPALRVFLAAFFTLASTCPRSSSPPPPLLPDARVGLPVPAINTTCYQHIPAWPASSHIPTPERAHTQLERVHPNVGMQREHSAPLRKRRIKSLMDIFLAASRMPLCCPVLGCAGREPSTGLPFTRSSTRKLAPGLSRRVSLTEADFFARFVPSTARSADLHEKEAT